MIGHKSFGNIPAGTANYDTICYVQFDQSHNEIRFDSEEEARSAISSNSATYNGRKITFYTEVAKYQYRCNCCNKTFGPGAIESHFINIISGKHTRRVYRSIEDIYYFVEYNSLHNINDGCPYFVTANVKHTSQPYFIVASTVESESDGRELEFDIPLRTTIEVTKSWDDDTDYYRVRPNDITLNVYRSIDNNNWGNPLTAGTDYNLSWNKSGNAWKATISNLFIQDSNGNKYYYKVVEQAPNYYRVTYSSGSNTDGKVENGKITIKNTLKLVTIDVVKTWDDFGNVLGLREKVEFNVFRSTNPDQNSWTILTKDKDYQIKWEQVYSGTEQQYRATISKLLAEDEYGNDYYFKVEEQEQTYYKNPSFQIVKYEENNTSNKTVTFTNELKPVNISGYVWLDAQTGIKPAIPADGKMGAQEERISGIIVNLYYKNPTSGVVTKVAETSTDKNGHYEFKDQIPGDYYVEFKYDGIHYEDTIKGDDSLASENETTRNTFNDRFKTITYRKSNDGTTLNYNYANRTSTLITTNAQGTTLDTFRMQAETANMRIVKDKGDINLGLVKRGTDIALSTDVYDAEVSINGQKTTYTYNREDNSIEIGSEQTNDKVSYNLNLYASDYNFRIQNYAQLKGEDFKEGDQESPNNPASDELNVNVIYEVNLQNQSTKTVYMNTLMYNYDSKYTFNESLTRAYNTNNNGLTAGYSVNNNRIEINLNKLPLTEGQTKTLYLVFTVNKNSSGLILGEFNNTAEITSYSTDEGLIDNDSQPGNFVNDNQTEDDNDKAGGLTIQVPANLYRRISGKVFDNSDNNKNVNDTIVQLIELKTVNGKVYEYIWEETLSGSGTGLKLNAAGNALERYTYNKADGEYEFRGFIPGDYIVRFIYGDGTTYDLTGNVIKYNGQDYKSMADTNYNKEWYNSSTYSEGASVARDNEARRLETMAYTVEIDAEKGVLLKLLNNLTADDLNETEKEILVSAYNKLYDPDITEITNDVITKLLKEQVLKNTWMCAETSKIKVPVDTQNNTNISANTTVSGGANSYANATTGVNLGIEKRPETKIELKKYITGFKLTASNGQTLVNAYIDVNEYLNNPGGDISTKVQGIKDSVTILGTVWQYEVSPTEINTVIDGSNLEFEYTLVVKNSSETDYLSDKLENAYENNTTDGYSTFLRTEMQNIKTSVRNGSQYSGGVNTLIGQSLGSRYYTGRPGSGNVVKTEVTSIRDYINNDLEFISGENPEGETIGKDEEAPKTHRILRDDRSMQELEVNTILETGNTGKMESGNKVVLYSVVLGKNPISSTGKLNFENFIAEVMSYTNAAGRRATTSTPGNAEIIDHEYRTGRSHEIDEADTARIQLGVSTGEEKQEQYIWLITIIGGVAIIASGIFVVKKYVLK